MNEVEDYIRAFKENSIKVTPQRLAIFKILERNTTHPSADMIYSEVLKIHPTISFATVYNTLDKLYELDFLLKLNIDGEKKHFDPDTSQHHHFQCNECKQIIDIFEQYNVQNPKIELKIEHYQINFYGKCESCNRKEEDHE